MDEDPVAVQSETQKKIAFAQSGHVEAVMLILREVSRQEKLVGDTEFETLKNAITLDAQAEMMIQFIASVDHIKKGGLHEPK